MVGEERRSRVYIWATWLAGLVAGTANCRWAAWYRAHFKFEKRLDLEPSRLDVWRADHAALLNDRVKELVAVGWTVRLEDENKFTYRGKVALVGGKPDIVATQQHGLWRIEDGKTGNPRESDVAQVAIYAVLAPAVFSEMADADVEGAVVYRGRPVRYVDRATIQGLRSHIVAVVRETAADAEPRRTPSAAECRFCDILRCPDRVADTDAELDDTPVEGALF